MRSAAPLLRRIAALAALACLLGSASPALADVGFRGPSFSGTSAPTGQKPQSKLWFADGTWWGSMFNSSTTDFEIFRLNGSTNAWSTTGTRIDERPSSRTDTLWDGSRLYVATAGTATTATGRILRYTYNSSSKSYTLDVGFPVTVVTGGVEALVLDKDSTGKLWITFTRGGRTYVSHSTSDDRTWTTPFALPVAGAANLTEDDISAVVAYDGRIGVMWSNQNDSAMYFASHRDGDPDGVWTSGPALQQPEYADDHISLRSLQADPSGRVFAATKTSLNSPGDPLILLLVLKPDGSWARHTFGRVSDNHSRPMVAIDRENRQLYMFASSPCCSGGAIYYKRTSLDSISFASGLGTPFIQSSTDTHINNLSSTKQELNSRTGLVAIAGDDLTRNYWHNRLALGPSGTTVFSDGFESGSFSAWSLVQSGGGGSATIQSALVRAGTYAARLSATSASGSFAIARRSLSPARTSLTVSGSFRVEAEGASGANVPLVRLFDPAGTRLVSVYRQNLSADRVWVGHSGANHSTTGKLPLRTWRRVDVRVVTAGTGASTLVVSLDGVEVYRTSTASLGTAGIGALQIGNDTRSQAFTLIADEMLARTP